jgi:hypothetical protein
MVKKAGLVMAVVAGSFLAGTPSALAQEVPGGVLSGNVIQIPVTFVIPVQACDNNVAAGLVAVAVDASHAGFCI